MIDVRDNSEYSDKYGYKMARCYLLGAPYHIDKPYDYRIPDDMLGSVSPGVFVTVPLAVETKSKAPLYLTSFPLKTEPFHTLNRYMLQ